MKTPPQPKAPRARVMFETEHRRGGTIILHTRTEPEDTPVSVIPRSKEAQEAMIEAGAKAVMKAQYGCYLQWATAHEAIRKESIATARACFASANLVEKE